MTKMEQVIKLRQAQKLQPAPTINVTIPCHPTLDVIFMHKIAKIFAWGIRQCDDALKKSAVLITWLLAAYIKVRSFAKAHKRGLVSKKTLLKRLEVCNQSCPWYSTHKDGRDYCDGVKCKCGEWAASSISWRIKLKSFACPARKFEGEK